MSLTNPATPDHSLFGRIFQNADPAGGGGAPPKEEPKPKDKSADAPAETEADRIARARAEAKAEALAEAKAERDREKAEADRLKAEEEGRWEELAKDNEAKFKTQKEENRKLRVHDALREYLADKHPERLKSSIDILPHVSADVDGDAIAPAVKVAAEAFIERNPSAAPKKPGGAPPAPVAGGRVPAGRQPIHRTSTAGVASSRF